MAATASSFTKYFLNYHYIEKMTRNIHILPRTYTFISKCDCDYTNSTKYLAHGCLLSYFTVTLDWTLNNMKLETRNRSLLHQMEIQSALMAYWIPIIIPRTGITLYWMFPCPLLLPTGLSTSPLLPFPHSSFFLLTSMLLSSNICVFSYKY